MKESFYRSAMLYGEASEAIFAAAHVAIFGVGGVGSYAAESLARAGVGRITLVDAARVKQSNLNRQACAEKSTVGVEKTFAMKKRIEAVSDCCVQCVNTFISAENAEGLIPPDADIVIDAVDNVTAKLALILGARLRGVAVLSSMGAGNRIDPTAVRLGDIYSTTKDPLSRVMRRELRKLGVEALTVAYSTETPIIPAMAAPDPDTKANAPASSPFVPAAFGLALSSEAIRLLLLPRGIPARQCADPTQVQPPFGV